MKELLNQYLSNSDEFFSFKILHTIHSSEQSTICTVELSSKTGNTINVAVKTPKQIYDLSFHQECDFYIKILTYLNYFQEKENIDELHFIPQHFNNSETDKILILEDLTTKGFINIPKSQFLDLEDTRRVLRDLASLHALSLALQQKDPRVFENKIKTYLHPPDPLIYNQSLINQISKELDIKICPEDVDKKARAPFYTLIHGDCDLSNIMLNSTTHEVKILDYRNCTYGSLAEDLIYFMYSSVRTEVLEEYTEGLFEFYHSNLVRVLEECKCDPGPFSFDALMQEMRFVAKESQFIKLAIKLYTDNSKDKLLFVKREFTQRTWTQFNDSKNSVLYLSI